MPGLQINDRQVAAKAVDELRGLVWFEVYLPIDLEALAEFSALEAEKGSARLAAEADPELAARALTPIDTQGEAMRAEDLQTLAHRWLTVSRQIDADHDKAPRYSIRVVESWINGPEVASPKFWPGAWIVVFQFDRTSEEWTRFLAGELQAVSFMAHTSRTLVTFRPVETPAATTEPRA